MLWLDSTSRTASRLHSSEYRARVALIIVFPFADCQLWDTFRAGKISVASLGGTFGGIPG